MLFYDCKNKYLFNFKHVEYISCSKYSMVIGEYAIFFFDHINLRRLEFEGLATNNKEYDSLDLKDIKNQAIIIHKSYLH